MSGAFVRLSLRIWSSLIRRPSCDAPDAIRAYAQAGAGGCGAQVFEDGWVIGERPSFLLISQNRRCSMGFHLEVAVG